MYIYERATSAGQISYTTEIAISFWLDIAIIKCLSSFMYLQGWKVILLQKEWFGNYKTLVDYTERSIINDM